MPNRARRERPGIRATDRIYDEVRRGILAHHLKPGEKITEELLAERFGVSRTPVRSAIVRLAGDGFVEMTPRSGTVVRRRSTVEIAEIYDVRALLEGAASGLAAGSHDAGDLVELKRLQGRMVRMAGETQADGTLPIEELSRLNRGFHQRILRASGNATLAESASRLMEIGFLINTYASFQSEGIARSLGDHETLIVAIESRDADLAEAVMRAHILGARNSLLRA